MPPFAGDAFIVNSPNACRVSSTFYPSEHGESMAEIALHRYSVPKIYTQVVCLTRTPRLLLPHFFLSRSLLPPALAMPLANLPNPARLWPLLCAPGLSSVDVASLEGRPAAPIPLCPPTVNPLPALINPVLVPGANGLSSPACSLLPVRRVSPSPAPAERRLVRLDRPPLSIVAEAGVSGSMSPRNTLSFLRRARS